MNGIINLHKPSGPTSFSVVSRVRKMLGVKKVGHGGTLDPLASGVLPIFLGQATRLAEYLLDYPKTYFASVILGVSTDSYDSDGQVVLRSDASLITPEMIEKALRKFHGEIMQQPPAYSAIKCDGKPLYELSRKGCAVNVKSRQVTIFRLEIHRIDLPLVEFEVECSKGTYIRSIAHDLGLILGCGAHLSGLVRSSYGPFCVKTSITPEDLEGMVARGDRSSFLQSPDSVLTLWMPVILTGEQARIIYHGGSLLLPNFHNDVRLRAYNEQKRLVALLECIAGSNLWHPSKVFVEQ
ncbi:MAG: tRNA pseudouridine(55) synthase TruB [Dehalococcoidia bacterium]|nr:tRNA pseudouridine(55) synthase TruB [Dehalococcoidia bacterium]